MTDCDVRINRFPHLFKAFEPKIRGLSTDLSSGHKVLLLFFLHFRLSIHLNGLDRLPHPQELNHLFGIYPGGDVLSY